MQGPTIHLLRIANPNARTRRNGDHSSDDGLRIESSDEGRVPLTYVAILLYVARSLWFQQKTATSCTQLPWLNQLDMSVLQEGFPTRWPGNRTTSPSMLLASDEESGPMKRDGPEEGIPMKLPALDEPNVTLNSIHSFLAGISIIYTN